LKTALKFMRVDGLCVSYTGTRILSDISFTLDAGEFLAIVGPNGGGKTTLIRTILGLMEKDAGTVSYPENGVPVSPGRGRPRIGYLPQRSSWADPLFPATVREVVASGLPGRRLRGSRIGAADEGAVGKALELLQIEDIAYAKVGHLSGGQQQRTHLARALVGEPELLVLDEPTGALDPSTRACFFRTLAGLKTAGKTTIIIVTHDTHNLSGYAEKILYLDREVLFFGPLPEYARLEAEHYFGRGHQECEP
jgi:zinc transport system ATP-binding protein